MPITGRYFPTQKPEEKVFLLLRRHWITYGAFIFVSIIMGIPLFIFLMYFLFNNQFFEGVGGSLLLLLAPTYTLFILAINLYGFVDYYLDIYIVTDERIINIAQNGFFKREVSELHLHQVQDVNASVKGIFPTMFHYGDIFIQTAGEKENFTFKSIPHPYRVSRKIIDLLEGILSQEKAKELSHKSQPISKTSKKIDANTIQTVTGINPETFKIARGRTKEFLAGNELEPVFADSSEVTSEVSAKESDEILNLIDKDEVKSIIHEDQNIEILDNLDRMQHGKSKSSIFEVQEEMKVKKKSRSKEEVKEKTPEKDTKIEAGELKENKEVDL